MAVSRRGERRSGWEDRVFREVAGPREPDGGYPPPLKSAIRRELETLWTPEGERELYEQNVTLLIPAGGYPENAYTAYFEQLDDPWYRKPFVPDSGFNWEIADYHRTVNPQLFPRLAAKGAGRFDGGKSIQSPLHWSNEVKRG